MNTPDEYKDLAVTAGVAGSISLVAATMRHVMLERHGGWRPLLRGCFASVVVAILVGWSLYAVSLPFPVEMAIVGVCAYLGDDILQGLLVIGRLLRENPAGVASRILDAIRGKTPVVESKPSTPTKGD